MKLVEWGETHKVAHRKDGHEKNYQVAYRDATKTADDLKEIIPVSEEWKKKAQEADGLLVQQGSGYAQMLKIFGKSALKPRPLMGFPLMVWLPEPPPAYPAEMVSAALQAAGKSQAQGDGWTSPQNWQKRRVKLGQPDLETSKNWVPDVLWNDPEVEELLLSLEEYIQLPGFLEHRDYRENEKAKLLLVAVWLQQSELLTKLSLGSQYLVDPASQMECMLISIIISPGSLSLSMEDIMLYMSQGGTPESSRGSPGARKQVGEHGGPS